MSTRQTLFIFLILSIPVFSQLNNVVYVTDYTNPLINNNEPHGAINPINSSNYIVATNYRLLNSTGQYIVSSKLGYHYTTNSGEIWVNSYFNYNDYDKYADPSVIFDNNGAAFLGYLGLDEPQYTPGNSGIFVEKSVSGGSSWERTIITQANWSTDLVEYDKPFLSVDKSNTSIFEDRAYISYSKANLFQTAPPFWGYKWNEIQLSYYYYDVTLGFTEPQTINDVSDDIFVGGSMPATDKNGNVYVIFLKRDLITQNDYIQIVQSTDGGNDFNGYLHNNLKEKTVAQIGYVPDSPHRPQDYILGFRCNSLPSIAVDISDGSYSNTIYVTWTEYLGESNPLDKTDIYLAKSTNGGLNWQNTGKINVTGIVETGHQFFPSISVNKDDGRINLLYYQLDDASTGIVEPRYVSSFDGGNTFYTDEWFEYFKDNFNHNNNNINKFFGDYISISNEDDKVLSVWTSNRQLDNKYPEVIIGIVTENELNFNLSAEVINQPHGRVTFNNQPYYFSSGNPAETVEYYSPLTYNFNTEPSYSDLGDGIYYKFRR